MQSDDKCIFCKIRDAELPVTVIDEDEHVLAFKDINPQAPTHFLVIPRKHIASINEIGEDDAELIGRLFLTARMICEDWGINKDGYRMVINNGRDGGQTVDHIHLHVLAGRQLEWPPG